MGASLLNSSFSSRRFRAAVRGIAGATLLIAATALPPTARAAIVLQRLGGSADADAHMMGVVVRGDRAYVSAAGGAGLRTYDLGDPARPAEIAALGRPAWRAVAAGDTLYSFCREGGLEIYDLSSGLPVLIGAHDPPGTDLAYEDGARIGRRLYVAAHQAGIHAFDLEDAGALRPAAEIAFTRAPNAAWALAARGGLLFVADGRHGLLVVDPAAPFDLAALALPGLAGDIELSADGRTAYLALAAAGVAAVDVSDPLVPRLRSLAPTRGPAFTLARLGDRLVVGSHPCVEIFDAADPDTLVAVGAGAAQERVLAAAATSAASARTLVVTVGPPGLAVHAVTEVAGDPPAPARPPTDTTGLPARGSLASDFVLLDTQGLPHRLHDARGSVVYLELGAPQSALGALRAAATDASIAARYEGNGFVRIWSIAATRAEVEGFRQRYGLRGLGLEDPGAEVFTRYTGGGAPGTGLAGVILDVDGRVAWASRDYTPGAIIAVIDSLVDCGCSLSLGDRQSGQTVLLLSAPRPSVFNAETTLRLSLAEAAEVSVSVRDAAGRLVRRLTSGTQAAGSRVLRWDGRDAGGRPVAGGVYLIDLTAPGTRQARRVVLTR